MDDPVDALERLTGHRFADPALARCALTHASASGPDQPANERLEFLGDAVVGLAISLHLYRVDPDLSEGQMTIIRSAVVSRRAMAHMGRELGLDSLLEVDPGLEQREFMPPSVLANAYEAVVGALLLDAGYDVAERFVLLTLGPDLERARARRHAPNYKSLLQQLTQREGRGLPGYQVVESEGPDHARLFRVAVIVEGQVWGTGEGQTKKDAEQAAARLALDALLPEEPIS